MDKKTVFVRTEKGESEAQGHTDELYGDLKRIFNLVDDESTVAEITKRAPPSLRSALEGMLQELVNGGYVRDLNEPESKQESNPAIKIASPAFKMAKPKVPTAPAPAETPAAPAAASRAASAPAFNMPEMPVPSASAPVTKPQESVQSNNKNDLDFSFIMSGASPGQAQADQDKQQANARSAADAQANAVAQAKAAQEAAASDAAAREAASKAAKQKAYEAAKMKAQIEVAARAKIEAEARAKKEAEAGRAKAEQDAMKARLESEAAKARIETEVRARLEAEARIKREAEATRLKAEKEAERLRQELEEAKIKAEIELRNRLEAEARAKAEHEARIKREAEAERLKLEKERAELEAARIKAEAELRMKEEAEARVRAALEARLKSEALARQNEENKARQESNTVASKRDMDPGEKLRESFVQTAGKDFRKQGYTTGSFKLEAFSLLDTGKMPAAVTGGPVKAHTPPPPPGGGSKVKAAIEERARKKAEEERLKAEQEMAGKAQLDAVKAEKEQDEAARIRVLQEEANAKAQLEANAQRLKAEHEAYRLKIQQEEEAAKAAAEAQQLAEQQAKQWEEAQQRAQALAIAEHERMTREAAEASKQAKKKPRGPRRKLPLGKIAGGAFVLALLAVFAFPYIWPLEGYITPLEAELSAQLKQPVHIKSMEAAILPLPKLTLHGVTVGSAGEIKAADVEMNFDISALFVPAKSINDLNLRNITLSGASLDKAASWLQAAGGLEKYPVAKISFKSARLDVPGMNLPAVNGRAEFNEVGKFVHAQFSTEDDKVGFEMEPQQGGMHLEFNLHEGTMPFFSSLKFSDLSFTATVANREIVLSDFFAHIHSGTLTGKGSIDWSNGWKLQSQINARNLDLQKMFPDYVVSGELGGDLSISMAGASVSQLDKDPHFEGSFEAKNGEIRKIDVETIARFGARQGVAGHTNFTEFSGTIRADRKVQHLYINNLATANAKTSGLIDVEPDQQLSGKLQVDFKGGLGTANVPVLLSGTPVEPVLQSGH